MANSQKLKYIQLAEQLRERIRSGELKVGDRLPSYVEMYEKYGATTATMRRVCDLLEQENLIERRRSSGIYVAPRKKSLTGNIGLLLHSHYWKSESVVPNTSAQLTLAGIRQACAEYQKEILLVDDSEAIHPEKTDGLLILCDKLEAYALGISPQMPHVIINQQADGISCVKIDDFTGGKLATSHLIENGHRRIACLIEGTFDETLQRAAGYQSALRNASIDIDACWLKQTVKINISPSFGYLEWGREQMRAWLDEDWHELGCTGIIVQNDYAAIGVIQILQEEGIGVPDEISVVGFDGTRVCDLVRPRLTSIQVPFYQMGYDAVKVLLAQMEHPSQKHAPATITLPVHLREGKSVKNLAQEKCHANL